MNTFRGPSELTTWCFKPVSIEWLVAVSCPEPDVASVIDRISKGWEDHVRNYPDSSVPALLPSAPRYVADVNWLKFAKGGVSRFN